MKLSEIMTGEQWAACVKAADGSLDKAKVFAAIGWHETHFGRTPGYGQEGYILGVGAYGGGQEEFRGLEAQLEWTARRLSTHMTYSLDDLQWYGREIQKPTEANGENTGNAWGRSVYSIYRDLEVDLPDLPYVGSDIPSHKDSTYQALPAWGQYLVLGLIGMLGFMLLDEKQ